MMTADRARELWTYNPETGVLTHNFRDRAFFGSDRQFKTWNTRFAGKEAGGLTNKGYLRTKYGTKRIMIHRIIWLIVTGSFPKNEIDHINHRKTDNRWVNLRDADRFDQCRNTALGKSNKSGHLGVYWRDSHQKWCASIRHGKTIHLGYFEEKTDAIAARQKAELLYGYHENHGCAP